MSEARLHFEDFAPGQVYELGRRTVDEAEIVRFARAFDPQPFHVDAEAARSYPYGGLIASGWHTASLAMRIFVDGLLHRTASMGSPGVDELRWLKPVRPGDTIAVRLTILDCVPSRSKPDRGVVRTEQEVTNQHGEVVLRMRGKGIFRRRPAEGPA